VSFFTIWQKCSDAKGKDLKLSTEQTKESLEIDGKATFQLVTDASYIYTAFDGLRIFETKNAESYPFTNFHERFVALGFQ
jgi:hypothetical protein